MKCLWGGRCDTPGYEDITGILNVLSLVAALMMAFVIPLQYMAHPREMVDVDFRNLLCQEKDFRMYVVDVMSWWDVGTYTEETFNFSVPVGKGEKFDVKHFLERGIEDTMKNDWRDCVTSPLTGIAVGSLTSDFPMHLVNVWVSKNHGTDKAYGFNSGSLLRLMSIVFLMFTLALLWSLLLYASLAMSTAQEDDSGRSMEAWWKYGRICILMTGFLLVVGLVLFFVCQSWYIWMMSPVPGRTRREIESCMYALIPMSIVMLVSSVMLTCRATVQTKAVPSACQGETASV